MARWIAAVTGGVASGKSAACHAFEALGRTVVDADLVSRDVVTPGSPGLAAVISRFGVSCLLADGSLDRPRLRQLVFADPDARSDLEAILHPLIRERMAQQAQAAPGPYVLVAVPLLTEVGGRRAYPWVARILVIDVSVELQRQRLLARDGGDAVQAERILAAQASRPARLALADDVIINDGSLAGLAAAVTRLDRRYLDLAGARSASSTDG